MKRTSTLTLRLATCGLTLLIGGGVANAAIVYVGGTFGATSYGVADYGPPVPGIPTFIGNNVTGNPDVLTSPGGTFLTADPTIPNNIASYLFAGPPFYTFQIGGGNANGNFGSGTSLVTGPGIGFSLRDTNPGGGSASYMITSWEANFVVDGGGYLGGIGNYLAIAGRNFFPADSSVVSLVSYWSVNGGGYVRVPDLILAANGYGPANGQADVAIGGSGAAMLRGPAGTFRGLAINNFGNFLLLPGETISIHTTVTAYADPAAIGSLFDIDPTLLSATGTTLPDFSLVSPSAAIPEPGTWTMFAGALIGVGLWRRRRTK